MTRSVVSCLNIDNNKIMGFDAKKDLSVCSKNLLKQFLIESQHIKNISIDSFKHITFSYQIYLVYVNKIDKNKKNH